MPSPQISRLRALAERRREADHLIPQVAARAREDGATLQEVGDALGVTRQAAWAMLSNLSNRDKDK